MTGTAQPPGSLLLIHGAWQGAWAWGKLAPLMQRRGWRTVAVDLPGNGADGTPPEDATFDGCLGHLLEAVAAIGGPLHVVAHSGAGVFASQLAEAMPDRLASVVYLAGMMLPSGVGFSEIVAKVLPDHPDAEGIRPYLEWSPDRRRSLVPLSAAKRIFFQDCTPEDAVWAAQRLVPQGEGARAVTPTLTAENFGRVPRIYIETALDRSVVPAAQRLMQKLSPGALGYVIESGHAPQLSRPEMLADLLSSALAAVAAEAESAG
jgi:pimeloyl-ACP methyl ester carboxylesterase